jgi:hypothetical protein
LPEDQFKFLELFLRRRGNLRDVERALGLSYPTVRARLDQVLNTLGFAEEDPETGMVDPDTRRREILDDLKNEKITADEAVRLISQYES